MDATRFQFARATRTVAILVSIAGIMIAMTILLWPLVTDWQQHRLAIRIVEELIYSDSRSSTDALRQVASIGYPTIDALVMAAMAEQSHVSLTARSILEEKLATWKVRAGSDKTFVLSEPLGLLAQSLAVRVISAGPMSQQWAGNLSLELVQLSVDIPAEDAVPILADCSTVMASFAPVGPRMLTTVGSNSAVITDHVRQLPDVKVSPLAHGNERGRVRSDRDQQTAKQSTSLQDGGLATAPTSREISTWEPQWSRHLSKSIPQKSETMDSLALSNTELNSDATEPFITIPSPDDMSTQIENLDSQETATLLKHLATADDQTAPMIRLVLKNRGLQGEELALARELISDDIQARLQLVDRLRILPARTARRWLRELLKDSNADVRLKALTAIATTNDPELVGIAREIAVSDADPRITELASRIMREAR